MIKQLRTKLIVALSALFAVFAVMSVIFAVTAKADENSSPSGDGVNVVYSESFDSIPEGFDNLELFGDYGAVITNGSFTRSCARQNRAFRGLRRALGKRHPPHSHQLEWLRKQQL